MKRNQPGDCSSCSSRWCCDALCESARYYVNTDYVGRSELPLGELLPPRPLPDSRSHPCLTPRELEIARFLVSGNTPKEIAKLLNIKVNSVYPHISRMRKKYR
jgi:DNA-binding NarL/FixJ family response regulator